MASIFLSRAPADIAEIPKPRSSSHTADTSRGRRVACLRRGLRDSCGDEDYSVYSGASRA